MPGEVIDTAFVEIRPITVGFAAATEGQVAAELGAVKLASVQELSAAVGTLTVEGEKAVVAGEQAAGAFNLVGEAATRSAGLVTEATAKETLSIEQATRIKIDAAIKERAELRTLAAEYNRVAAAATVGSEEQVAAARLAQRANEGLAASAVATTRAAGGSAVALGAVGAGLKGFAGVTIAALGVEALAHSLGHAVTEAGELQKSEETVRAVFGASAKEVQNFVDKSHNIGVSAHDAEAISARIGILGHNLHISSPLAADMAVNLEKLGASIAQVRGGDPEKLLSRLPLVLAGNIRAVKEWGFSFSQAQIKQAAVTAGAIRQKDALTPAAKAIGIYTLLMKDLPFFEQEAAKHADDLVNQEHRLSATNADVNESLGALLRGGLAKFKGGIADAENGLLGWIHGLRESKTAQKDVHGVGEALGKVFHVIGNVFRENRPVVREFFDNMGKGLHIAATLAKPLIYLLGVGLVGGLKAAVAGLRILNFSIEIFRKTFLFAVDKIVSALDGLLGGISSLAGIADKILPGNPFKDAQKSIDTTREKLRGFRDDLLSVDGKHVSTTVDVNIDIHPPKGAPTLIDAVNEATRKAAVAQGGVDKPVKPVQDLPVISQRKEKRLQDAVSLAAAKEDVAGQEKALRELAAFYRKLAENDKFSVALRRGLLVAAAQTDQAIRQLEDQQAQNAKDAADKAKAAAKAKRDAADQLFQTRLSSLQDNLRIAEATTGTLADDIRAEQSIVHALEDRVRQLRGQGERERSAIADLKTEQKALADLRQQVSDQRLAATEDRLKDNLTLAGFTKSISDDRRALIALERFYDARVRNSKKGSVARRKWMIELERTKAELRDLEKAQKDTSDAARAAIRAEQFDFLKTQQGFAANLASNLLANVGGLVGGTTPKVGISPTPLPTAPLSPVTEPRPLPVPAAIAAEAAAAAGGNPPKATQLEQLISLTRQSLQELRAIHAGRSHPEARSSRTLAHHATETSPA